MSAPELCPARRHDREEERVICMWEEHIPGAWGFICPSCWKVLEDARACRKEWELEE
jgi:hypothetical protein